jgi:8-oxo-dGTP pyrophosphatase MutT (NUDIX family)
MGRTVTRAPGRSGVGPVLVRAAGGILLRPVRTGRFEVVVVHRPDRDDWSLPKGKLDEGETFEAAALREVLEETGYRCRLVRFVGFTEYRDRRDRPKVVGYWHMEVLDGEFRPSREVDDVRWLDLDIAVRALTYRRDRELLRALDPVALARSG